MRSSPNKLRAALLGLLWVSVANAAEIDETMAAGVMAAYLRYIAALTSWPGDEAAAADRPIRIGVVGRDPNGVMTPIRARTQSGEGLLAQDRQIELLDLQSAGGDRDRAQIASCALLFLSEGAEADWQRLRPVVGALPIVTVSEMEGFTDQGGMIEYFVDRRSGKVRMKVNLPAVRAAGVSLSARFLTLNSVILVDEREAVR